MGLNTQAITDKEGVRNVGVLYCDDHNPSLGPDTAKSTAGDDGFTAFTYFV